MKKMPQDSGSVSRHAWLPVVPAHTGLNPRKDSIMQRSKRTRIITSRSIYKDRLRDFRLKQKAEITQRTLSKQRIKLISPSYVAKDVSDKQFGKNMTRKETVDPPMKKQVTNNFKSWWRDRKRQLQLNSDPIGADAAALAVAHFASPSHLKKWNTAQSHSPHSDLLTNSSLKRQRSISELSIPVHDVWSRHIIASRSAAKGFLSDSLRPQQGDTSPRGPFDDSLQSPSQAHDDIDKELSRMRELSYNVSRDSFDDSSMYSHSHQSTEAAIQSHSGFSSVDSDRNDAFETSSQDTNKRHVDTANSGVSHAVSRPNTAHDTNYSNKKEQGNAHSEHVLRPNDFIMNKKHSESELQHPDILSQQALQSAKSRSESVDHALTNDADILMNISNSNDTKPGPHLKDGDINIDPRQHNVGNSHHMKSAYQSQAEESPRGLHYLPVESRQSTVNLSLSKRQGGFYATEEPDSSSSSPKLYSVDKVESILVGNEDHAATTDSSYLSDHYSFSSDDNTHYSSRRSPAQTHRSAASRSPLHEIQPFLQEEASKKFTSLGETDALISGYFPSGTHVLVDSEFICKGENMHSVLDANKQQEIFGRVANVYDDEARALYDIEVQKDCILKDRNSLKRGQILQCVPGAWVRPDLTKVPNFDDSCDTFHDNSDDHSDDAKHDEDQYKSCELKSSDQSDTLEPGRDEFGDQYSAVQVPSPINTHSDLVDDESQYIKNKGNINSSNSIDKEGALEKVDAGGNKHDEKSAVVSWNVHRDQNGDISPSIKPDEPQPSHLVDVDDANLGAMEAKLPVSLDYYEDEWAHGEEQSMRHEDIYSITDGSEGNSHLAHSQSDEYWADATSSQISQENISTGNMADGSTKSALPKIEQETQALHTYFDSNPIEVSSKNQRIDPPVRKIENNISLDSNFDALIETLLRRGQITFKKVQKMERHIHSGKQSKEHYLKKLKKKLRKPSTPVTVAIKAQQAAIRAQTPRARRLSKISMGSKENMATVSPLLQNSALQPERKGELGQLQQPSRKKASPPFAPESSSSPTPSPRVSNPVYGCDFNCGFRGSFQVVADHEETCDLNPKVKKKSNTPLASCTQLPHSEKSGAQCKRKNKKKVKKKKKKKIREMPKNAASSQSAHQKSSIMQNSTELNTSGTSGPTTSHLPSVLLHRKKDSKSHVKKGKSFSALNKKVNSRLPQNIHLLPPTNRSNNKSRIDDDNAVDSSLRVQDKILPSFGLPDTRQLRGVATKTSHRNQSKKSKKKRKKKSSLVPLI